MDFFCGDEEDFRISPPPPAASTAATYHGSPADLYLFDADRSSVPIQTSRQSHAIAAETSSSSPLKDSPDISDLGIHGVSRGHPIDRIASAFAHTREHGVTEGSLLHPCPTTESLRFASSLLRQGNVAVISSAYPHRTTALPFPHLRELATAVTSPALPHGSTTSALPHVRGHNSAATSTPYAHRTTASSSRHHQRDFDVAAFSSVQQHNRMPSSRPTDTTSSSVALRQYVDISTSLRTSGGAGPSDAPRPYGDVGGPTAPRVHGNQDDRFDKHALDSKTFQERPTLPNNEMARLLRAQRNREAAHRSRAKNKLRQSSLEAETTRLLKLHQELRRLLSFLVENFNPGFRGHGIAASIFPHPVDHTIIPHLPPVMTPPSDDTGPPQSPAARNEGDPRQE